MIAFLSILFPILFGPFTEEDLYGKWSQVSILDDVTTYASVTEEVSERWIEFLPAGKLRVRQNAGWCGTPPVTYRVFDGSYLLTGKDQLTTINAFWGGLDTIHYQIIHADEQHLELKYLGRGTAAVRE